MDRHFSVSDPGCRAFFVSLGLLAVIAPARPASADAPPAIDYQVQPILKLGDPIGDGSRPAVGRFRVGSLNDAGELAFASSSPRGDTLLRYSGGAVTLLGTAPGSGS
jgi:hypothetical protein